MKVHIPDVLRERVNAICANTALAEAGRLLAEQGIIRIAGFPDAEVDLLSDWKANPFENRSWQWNNASFNFVPSLIAAHSQGASTAVEYALRALSSWRTAVLGPLRKYEFAFNDHATARQAENLILLLAYLVKHDVERESWEKVRDAILDHATQLERDDFYSKYTNHGIEQCRILGMIGDFLPEAEHAAEWLKLAMERLRAELDHAFTREGVHVENSPGYHGYVSLSFIKIRDYFSDESMGELAAEIDRVIPKAIRFLVHATRPDGRFPQLGDTHSTKVINHFRRYRGTREFSQLKYVLNGGVAGTRPRQNCVLFPEAGYFVARDAWNPPASAANAFHLIFRCGFHSTYHRHDDDLSIVMYCEGEDWLLDSGAYNYSEADPVRRYMRSKWAHNVPVLMKPASKRWDQEWPPLTTPMRQGKTLAGHSAVRAISHSYPGHVAIRDLELDLDRRQFIVRDALVQSIGHGNRRYLSLWHFPSDKRISIEGQTVEVHSTRTGNRLLIRNQGKPARSISLIDPGIEGVQGSVVSYRANELGPAQLLAFEWGGRQLQAELCFSFDNGVESERGDQ